MRFIAPLGVVDPFVYGGVGGNATSVVGDRTATTLEGSAGAIVPVGGGIEIPLGEKARLGTCEHCVEVMDLFADAYAAEAGNLALRTVATRGVYIGGGIAPKNLHLLTRPAFVERFRQKGAMSDLMATIPLKVILNPQAGLLGAATVANQS